MWHLTLGGGESYPERSGVPNCVYYMRTGVCGYGGRCRYNHPRDRLLFILYINIVFSFFFFFPELNLRGLCNTKTNLPSKLYSEFERTLPIEKVKKVNSPFLAKNAWTKQWPLEITPTVNTRGKKGMKITPTTNTQSPLFWLVCINTLHKQLWTKKSLPLLS